MPRAAIDQRRKYLLDHVFSGVAAAEDHQRVAEQRRAERIVEPGRALVVRLLPRHTPSLQTRRAGVFVYARRTSKFQAPSSNALTKPNAQIDRALSPGC